MSFALYRKYRPQRFDLLVGQDVIRHTLLQALKQEKISHAYLFSGPRGTGKTSAARLIAKAIQCASPKESGEPCETCAVCQMNNKGECIDLIEIDAASNRGIEDIRDLREKMRLMPSYAKSKVYIIDEVHMLTKEAFNALLKSLEEPPAHVHFILATTEIHKIPETILSRCQRYDFKRISERSIVEQLQFIAEQEGIEAEIPALELLAKSADGGMRDAISLLQQFSGEKITEDLLRERLGLHSNQYCEELYAALGSSDTQKGLKAIEDLHREGLDLLAFTVQLLTLLRTKLHEAIHADKTAVIPKLTKWIELFDEAWIKLKSSSIAQLPLELAMIRATQSMAVPKVEAAASKTVAIVPTAPPVPVAASQEKRAEGLLHLDAIKQQMAPVLRSIQQPAVRQSFQTGILKKQEGHVLTFVFTSGFHLDKVSSAEGMTDIEEAFEKILGRKMKIEMELDSGSMTPEVPEAKDLGWDVVVEDLT